MAKVSVVIPTYNQADFLYEAIQSVMSQTYTDWELIIVNNYSEDNTEEVVTSLSDARIRMVNFRNSGIIAASRNKGIELAQGEIIAFLDSDDKWYPTKLSRCVEHLDRGADLVSHGLYFTKGGIPWRRITPGPSWQAQYDNLLYGNNCIYTSAVVVRKECLLKAGNFCEQADIVTAEDYDLWLKIARNGANIYLDNEILGEYRLHGTNATKAVMRNANAILVVIEKHFSQAQKNEGYLVRLRMRRRRALVYYGAARAFQEAHCQLETLKLLLKAFWIYPFRIRTYLAFGLLAINTVKKYILKCGNTNLS